MPTSKTVLAVVLALAAIGGCARSADRGPIGPAHTTPATAPSVSLTLEDEMGAPLPTFFHMGSVFVAGQQGQGYAIRLQNHTPERIEAVVTVDGRDVISGQLGNYKKQRGYVLEPFGSIRIDGFRQSIDHVAAFRFSGLQDSYTARQGTAQHAGVIGMALFREKPSKQKSKPIAVGPAPFPAATADASTPAQPFPGGSAAPRSDGNAPADERAAKSAPAAESAPAADSDDAAFEQGEAPATATRADGGSGFAPPPQPRNELGTEYGETRVSSVHEVAFKRARRTKPDEMFTVFYDSHRGLAARGVPVDNGPLAIGPEPDPFPGRTR